MSNTSHDKEYYLNLRNLYHPDNLKYIFILEAPPSSGLYFYDESGGKSEPLFNEMMKLLKFTARNKKEGLEYFQKCGYLLVDATYQYVDKLKGEKRNDKIRNKIIKDDFDLLIDDLKNINPEKKVPLILVKANICAKLEPELNKKGFNVLNNGMIVYFPSHSRQTKFHQQIGTFFKHQNPQDIKK